MAKSVEAVERGATEVCIQGGLPSDLDGHYYVKLLRAIKTRLPDFTFTPIRPWKLHTASKKPACPFAITCSC